MSQTTDQGVWRFGVGMDVGAAYILSLGTLAILNVACAVYLWFNRAAFPHIMTWSAVMLCSTWVCITYHLMTTAPSAEIAFAFARLRFLGFSLAPVLTTIFVLKFSGQQRFLTRRWIAAAMAIPIFTQAVVWVGPFDTLFFEDWGVVAYGRYLMESGTLVGWYFFHNLYNGLLVVLMIAAMGHYAWRVDSTKRRTITLLSICLVFVTYGLLSSLRIGPPPGFRLSPIFLGLGSVVAFAIMTRFSFLRDSLVPYDVVFTSILDAALVVADDGMIVQTNPAAQRMFGGDHRALTGARAEDVLNGYHAQDRAQASTRVLTVDYGGRSRVCEVQDMPIGDTGTHLLLVRDVTAQRDAERRQVALRDERERSKILAQFMQDASHEFRTPLSVIQTGIYLLRKQTDPDRQAKYADQIEDQTARLSALIGDLQLMTRIDFQPDMLRMPLDLNTVVRVAAAPYPSVRVMPADPPVKVFADEDLLTTAFYKVFDNAVRYSGVDQPVEVTVSEHDGIAQIVICDRGPGMTGDAIEQAFQRFFRADVARSSAGFGLGLPIVKRVMELHDGAVRLESKLGSGTIVTLSLPVDRVPRRGNQPESSASTAQDSAATMPA